jgi:DNA-binding transcriptional MerR regulator/methylmalonyl-CoA mutase cobalamin-binding subunit
LSTPITNTISDVERETGLAKETLRVWERRYEFPQPLRDALGERVYPIDQVQKLRVIKRLIDRGYRPGKIIQLNLSALQKLAEESGTPRVRQGSASEKRADLQDYLALCKEHQVEQLRRKLSQAVLHLGLHHFVIDLIAPLTELIGEGWATGHLAVFEEHLYSESVQVVLRNAISQIPQDGAQLTTRPRIILTTFPQERHGLGLLMAEALFSLEGAHCISLGVQTPIMEITDAAKAQRADIVALSFSSAMNGRQTLDGLNELRSRLPASIEIWAGGECAALLKRSPEKIQVMSLLDISSCLAEWRQQNKV